MSDGLENGPVAEEQNVNAHPTLETEASVAALSVAPAVIPDVVWGTGRRKSSVARVRVKLGTGRVLVNGREFKEYFPSVQYQNVATAPLRVTGTTQRFDVFANINGGGLTGQSGALSLGIARALKVLDQSLEQTLRDMHLMTRDPRMKERKKYGLHGARRGVQFSKR
jgi:small subunit ribosomal protein S9